MYVELQRVYHNKLDDELLDLHATGTLTDLAYKVLEAELETRNLSIPKRPESLESDFTDHTSIKAHWKGHARLSSAFLGFGIIGEPTLKRGQYPLI